MEIEGIINSRLMTYLASDQDGVTGSLSPSHLINGRRLTALSNDEHFEIVSTHQSLIRRLKYHRESVYQAVAERLPSQSQRGPQFEDQERWPALDKGG